MTLRVFLTVSSFIFVLTSCSGQVVQFGTCAQVETVKLFDIERFLGKWYEIERFPVWYEISGSCAFKTIEFCGNQIEIQHGFVKNNIQYILHVNSSYNPGDEAVFEIKENNVDPVGIPLSVTFTDYDNYAIVYGCKSNDVRGLKHISAWILSRNTTLHPEILDKATIELNSLPYASIAYLRTVNQDTEQCKFHWTAHVNSEDRAGYYEYI